MQQLNRSYNTAKLWPPPPLVHEVLITTSVRTESDQNLNYTTYLLQSP